jgi:hypothetical protein
MATILPENFADRVSTVANGCDVNVPAARPSHIEWLKRPAISGLECVRALRQARFVVLANVAGRVDLQRGDVRVEVPLANPLEPMVLVAILQRAGISPARFLALLDD